MKKSVLFAILIIVLSGVIITSYISFNNDKMIKGDIDLDGITHIQFIEAGGNPDYLVSSKIITSRDEIDRMVTILKKGVISTKLAEEDITDADSSVLLIRFNDSREEKWYFNGNDTSVLFKEGAWYKVLYNDISIWNMYKASTAETIEVDKDKN